MDHVGGHDADEGGQEEEGERDVYHRRGQVDEPVGQKWGHSQEQQEPEEVVTVILGLLLEQLDLVWEGLDDEVSAEGAGEEVAEGGAESGRETDEREADDASEESSGQNAENEGSRDGEGLEARVRRVTYNM